MLTCQWSIVVTLYRYLTKYGYAIKLYRWAWDKEYKPLVNTVTLTYTGHRLKYHKLYVWHHLWK